MTTITITEPAKVVGRSFDVVEILGDPKRPIAVSLERCSWRALYAIGAHVSIWYCHNPRQTGVGCRQYPSWIQLDKCQCSSIRFCDVCNGWDSTAVMPEDQISLYQTTDSIVADCWVEGLPGPCPSKHSGSGINIDDGCRKCRVERCYAVNTGNAGICITGGQNNRLVKCCAASEGKGANGDVGFQIHNYYPDQPWGDNRAVRCYAAWRTRRGRWNNYLEPKAAHWQKCGELRSAGGDVGKLMATWRRNWERLRNACVETPCPGTGS